MLAGRARGEPGQGLFDDVHRGYISLVREQPLQERFPRAGHRLDPTAVTPSTRSADRSEAGRMMFVAVPAIRVP